MPAGKYNMTMERDSDFDRTVTWYTDSAGTIAKNLTGYTAFLEVRKSPGSTVILLLSTSNGRITLGGVAGTIALHVDNADTDALTPGTYQYDLVLQGGGTTTRLLEGTCYVKDKITEVT